MRASNRWCSHLDTVVDGGALDGAYGTVAAFQIIAALAAAGERLLHPVRAVAWANEEGVVAPPFTGSRAAVGLGVDLAVTGPDGRSLVEVLVAGGEDPSGLAATAWAPIAGYLELHIEQGSVLDDLEVPIGVVTAIAGSRRGRVVVTGRPDHAGTTPMHQRSDALAAAAPLVARIAELATDGPADVATVGSLVVEPGSANVIPGRVTLSYDIRGTKDAACAEALEMLRVAANAVAAETGTMVAIHLAATAAAVPTSLAMRALVADAARGLGLHSVELASGAGHDAQHLVALGPMGMIFVPSTRGVSHSPAEATPPEQLIGGARTLLAALRLADRRIGR